MSNLDYVRSNTDFLRFFGLLFARIRFSDSYHVEPSKIYQSVQTGETRKPKVLEISVLDALFRLNLKVSSLTVVFRVFGLSRLFAAV